MKRFIFVPLVLIVITMVASAQSASRGPAPGDWPLYSRTLSGTRYSPLTEINTSNVAKLAPAWSIRLTQPAGRRGEDPLRVAKRHPLVVVPAPRGTPQQVRRVAAMMNSRPPAATRKRHRLSSAV